jgi:hypothetical protein
VQPLAQAGGLRWRTSHLTSMKNLSMIEEASMHYDEIEYINHHAKRVVAFILYNNIDLSKVPLKEVMKEFVAAQLRECDRIENQFLSMSNEQLNELIESTIQ